MQNYAKNFLKNANAMTVIAVTSVLIFATVGQYAFADNLQADALDSSTLSVSVQEGSDTDVEYWLVANGADGCNVDATHPATVTLNVPSGVSASLNPFTLTQCKVGSNNNGVTITFTGDTTGGPYTVDVASVTGGKAGNNGYIDNQADGLTITVTEPPGPSDTTPPEISHILTPSSPDGENGWYVNSVKIDWTVTDAESDVTIDSGCVDETITDDTDSSGITPGCEAHSEGGSSSDSVNPPIKKDGTAPTVELSGGPEDGGSYYYGFVPTEPTCTADDPTPGSGLAEDCSVTGYDQSVGTHTVKAIAGDNAGNTAEDAATYTVKAWDLRGFYQPVDNGATVNTVKGGSTVPFKFEIFAQDELTSTTFNGNPIGTFSAKKVACTTSATEDTIEVTATGGTSLRYDATSGQFVYNWQTPKGAGICYDTTLTTLDGSSLTAHFKTK